MRRINTRIKTHGAGLVQVKIGQFEKGEYISNIKLLVNSGTRVNDTSVKYDIFQGDVNPGSYYSSPLMLYCWWWYVDTAIGDYMLSWDTPVQLFPRYNVDYYIQGTTDNNGDMYMQITVSRRYR